MLPPCLRNILFFSGAILTLVLFGNFLVRQGRAQSFELLPTSVEVMLSCGDGFAEQLSGEVCDPGNPGSSIPPDIGTSTCQDFNDIYGNPFQSGDLGCLSDCSDFATSTCYSCGNGSKEPLEACEGNDFGSASCITFGFSSGALVCTIGCQINTANCVADEEPGGNPGSGSSGGSPGGLTGFTPGSETQIVTRVVVEGKSYPHADVHILVDGKVIGIVKTDAKADFYFETDEVAAGVASFSFWSEDSGGLKSTLLTLTFRVISNAVTTITGVYIAPTIEVDQKSVRKGDPIKIYGQTVPETAVKIHVNSVQEFIEQTTSLDDGDYELVFDTSPLDEDFHIAKALFQIEVGGNIIKSGFSKSVSFHVGKIGGEPVCPGADLNGDGRVNLTDFSILLFYWGTDNECADQDQSGNVDLVDFSIMMFYWTG